MGVRHVATADRGRPNGVSWRSGNIENTGYRRAARLAGAVHDARQWRCMQLVQPNDTSPRTRSRGRGCTRMCILQRSVRTVTSADGRRKRRSIKLCSEPGRALRSAPAAHPTSSAGCPRRTGSTAAVTVLALGRSRRRAAPLLYGWRARRVHRLRLSGSRGDTMAVWSMRFVSRGATGRELWC